jgi:uroporphyrinogen decarboxylase
MTSRQRVLDALNHKPVDRPPFDCTLTIDVYNRLIKAMNLDLPPKTDCSLFLTVQLDEELIRALGLDFAYLPLSANTAHPRFRYGQDHYIDQWGVDYKRIEMGEGLNYVNVNAPLLGASINDLASCPWPDPDEPSLYKGLRERAKGLAERTGCAIIGLFGGTVFTEASLIRGMQQWYLDLLLEPEFAVRLMEILAGYYARVYCNALAECGEYLDILRIDNDDYGTQESLLISPEVFRGLVKPVVSKYYKTVKDFAKKYNPHIRLMKHSCGAVSEFIDDFIEMGIDILDPVQVSAKGMEISKLKDNYGDRIAFHGGIDTQHVLPHCTPQEVEKFVQKTISVLGRNGGYIVCPVHHVEGDVPAENILAMRTAVMTAGNKG